MSSTVDEIKGRLGIADVIGSYIKLEKAGANFKARCPFHSEKTASFFVSPTRDSYYCFGCSRGGDIFTFVQEFEGIDFRDALKLLAERAGVELSRHGARDRTERDRYRAAMSDAVEFYHARLAAHPSALTYLKTRGLSKETIDSFRIGYAPAEWHSVRDALAKKHRAEDLVAIGLTAVSKGRTYDRFRNRIMFPIADASGNVIAFSGRIFGDEGSAENTRISQLPGKYVNSPDSPLFDKSRALFGFDRAKMAIRESDTAVLVEGQFDVVLSHQAGVVNTVAVSGTAFTDAHVETLSRLARRFVMAFDGDPAGIRASGRAIDLLLAQGSDIRVVRLLPGSDPADTAARDPIAWRASVAESEHFIDFLLNTILDGDGDAREKGIAVTERVLPYITRLGRATEQAHFIGKIAVRLGISEDPLWSDCNRIASEQRGKSPTRASDERADKNLSPKVAAIGSGVATRLDTLLRRLVGAYWITDDRHIAERVISIVGSPTWETARATHEGGREVLLFEMEMHYGSSPPENEIEHLLGHLEQEVVKQELDTAVRALRRGEERGDRHAIDEALALCNDLGQRLARLTRSRESNRN